MIKKLVVLLSIVVSMFGIVSAWTQPGTTFIGDNDMQGHDIKNVSNLTFDASGSDIDFNGRLLDDYNSTKPVSCQVISRSGMYLLFNATGCLINQTDDFGKLAMHAYETTGVNKLDIGYGTFYCSTSINQSKYRYKQMIFEGQGYTGTIIAKGTGLTRPIFDCRFNGTTNSDWRGMEIKHLGINGIDKSVDGVRLNYTIRTKILDSVKIYNCRNGLILDDFCILNSFENSYFRDNIYAMKLTSMKYGANIENTFLHCMANDNDYGLLIEEGTSNSFSYMELEGNDIGNLLILKNASLSTYAPSYNTIYRSYFEDVGTAYNINISGGTNASGPANNLIDRCDVQRVDGGHPIATVNSGFENIIRGCHFGGSASSTVPYHIITGSNADSTIIEDNECKRPYSIIIRGSGKDTISRNNFNMSGIPNDVTQTARYTKRLLHFDWQNRTGLVAEDATITYAPNGTIQLTSSTSAYPKININTTSYPGLFMRYVHIKYKYIHGYPTYGGFRIYYTTAAHPTVSTSYYYTTPLRYPVAVDTSAWCDLYADMWALAAGGTDWKTSNIISIQVVPQTTIGNTIAFSEINLIGVVT